MDITMEKKPLQDVELAYETCAGIGYRAHIGFIVLSNDQSLSHEARLMLTVPGVAVYEARQKLRSIPQGDRELTEDSLSDLRDSGISEAADRINDRRVPNVVAYGCTSGAMVVGDDALTELIREVLPDTLVTNPLKAALAALAALQCKSIALVSPYPKSLSDDMVHALEKNGYRVPVYGRFHIDGKNQSFDAPFISPDSIEKAVMELGSDKKVDAVFVSCTQMRFAERIAETELRLGKPIITSNQALCWHSLRLSGCGDKLGKWGSLFEQDLAD